MLLWRCSDAARAVVFTFCRQATNVWVLHRQKVFRVVLVLFSVAHTTKSCSGRLKLYFNKKRMYTWSSYIAYWRFWMHTMMSIHKHTHKHDYAQIHTRPGGLRGLTGSALDHRSLPREFESRRRHIWRVFHLWLLFITFGCRSAHLPYHVHKSGRKNQSSHTRAHTQAYLPPRFDDLNVARVNRMMLVNKCPMNNCYASSFPIGILWHVYSQD